MILLPSQLVWQLLSPVCATHTDMTAELESDMTSVAEGKDTRDGIVITQDAACGHD